MTPVSGGGEKKVYHLKSESELDLEIRRGSDPKTSDNEPPPTRLKKMNESQVTIKGGNVGRAGRAKIIT
jgi:hypothetical protein